MAASVRWNTTRCQKWNSAKCLYFHQLRENPRFYSINTSYSSNNLHGLYGRIILNNGINYSSVLSLNKANQYNTLARHTNERTSLVNKATKTCNQALFYSRGNYSKENETEKRSLPKLMNFPEIVWPSLIKSIRNWVIANLIITPYFDNEFNLPEFISGSKQALEYVSGCLADGAFDCLSNTVSDVALNEVKNNVATFSLQQRQELSVKKDDIYFSFPYQIGVIFSDDDKNQQRFVEITMVYHCLKGLKEMTDQGISPPLNMGMLPEYRDKIHICNYRFIREFTKGIEGQWTVNVINHFKPSDFIS